MVSVTRVIYAKLSGTWTNITADIFTTFGLVYEWGMSTNNPLDLLAASGRLEFTLLNNSGKYYRNSASHLAGWDYGTEIKVVYTYDGYDAIKFQGFIIGLSPQSGTVANQDVVKVTVGDWMEYAGRTKIVSPQSATGVLSGRAVTNVVALNSQQPGAVAAMSGDNTFPVVFDGNTAYTTAYAEFAKIANSELGRIYQRFHPVFGSQLVFDSASYRDGGAVAVMTIPAPSATSGYMGDSGGDYFTDSAGNPIIMASYSATGTLSTNYTGLTMSDGQKIINRILQTANPKYIDVEPTVVYSLDNPVLIAAGTTVTFDAPYSDQRTTGRRINVITSSMQTPVAPGVANPYLMTLLHFATDATDSTGRHTWTPHTAQFGYGAHQDGFGKTDIAGSIMGGYLLNGGVATDYISTPTSADFDFGGNAFTVSWWESRVDITSGKAAIARDYTAAVPPFLLGYSDGANLSAYISSNGTSWDIASAKSMGPVNVSGWTHYEVNRDDDKWFRIFVGGKLLTKWYSPLSILSSTGTLSIGLTLATQYLYAATDEFFILKGKCLHKEDFIPSTIELSATLTGDYWMNTDETQRGTDLSSSLTPTVTFGAEKASISLQNTGVTDGYGWIQLRGFGIYPLNIVQKVYEDTTSEAGTWGTREVQINQKYQYTVDASGTRLQSIITNYKNANTFIDSIKFWANSSDTLMWNFLVGDIGKKVPLAHTRSGESGNYYIARVKVSDINNTIQVEWKMQKDI